MTERDHEEELAQLKLHAAAARREHRTMIMVAATSSSVVFASLGLAIFTDDPAWLNTTMATASLLGSILAIHETETAQEELKEAQRKVEDYQRREYLSRLRS